MHINKRTYTQKKHTRNQITHGHANARTDLYSGKKNSIMRVCRHLPLVKTDEVTEACWETCVGQYLHKERASGRQVLLDKLLRLHVSAP
jgi:hypothetical protein